jgi:beta-galactosidase
MGFREFICRDHPGVRDRTRSLIETLAATVQGHPALAGWQLDNEPHYGDGGTGDSIHDLLDFHPCAWQSFQQWLQRHAGDLHQLNERWFSGFWSQRLASREDLQPALVVNNPHARLDWMRWRDANLAEHLREQIRWIRAHTPDTPIGTNLPSCGLREQVLLGIDPVDQCRDLDWVGGDVYGADGEPGQDLDRIAALTDLQRGSAPGKPFLIAEAQAAPHQRVHFGFFATRQFPPAEAVEVWTRTAERGAQALWWFQWRAPRGGIERGMNGLTGIDGTPGPYTDTARELAQRDMSAERARFVRRPQAVLALHRDSLRALAWSPRQLMTAEQAFLGWHRLLEDAGFRVEIREAPFWSLGEDLPMVLFRTILLAPEQRTRLARRPGRLWCGPDTGFYDEHGRLPVNPACPMTGRMGLTPGAWHDHPPPPGPETLPALSAFRDLLPDQETRVLLARPDGIPCLCRSPGTTTAGFCAGEAYTQADPQQKKRLADLVSEALLPA